MVLSSSYWIFLFVSIFVLLKCSLVVTLGYFFAVDLSIIFLDYRVISGDPTRTLISVVPNLIVSVLDEGALSRILWSGRGSACEGVIMGDFVLAMALLLLGLFLIINYCRGFLLYFSQNVSSLSFCSSCF